jgi:hypothetical protein
MSNQKKEKKHKFSLVDKKKGIGFKNKLFKKGDPSQKFSRKRFAVSVIIFALGISMIPIGIVFGTDTENYSNAQIIKQQFPTVLLSVKSNLEQQFDELIEEMRNDPLNGLFVDKLPTPEEIFFEEWANDWFPKVDIPTIGGYIESAGAKGIGDIDLDGRLPQADLNISTKGNPSGITIDQCRALWNAQNTNSLVSKSPTIWFETVEGSPGNREHLKEHFNLTEIQLNLICNWINTSQNTWLPYLAQQERLILNPLPLFGLLAIGALLLVYSTPKVTNETRKMLKEKNTIDPGKIKSKIKTPNNDKEE